MKFEEQFFHQNLRKYQFYLQLNTGYVVRGEGSILKTMVGGGALSVRETVTAQSFFTLTPNPAYSGINISTTRKIVGETTISIYNTSGQQLIHRKFSNQIMVELDVSKLATGIYLVLIQTKNVIETMKLGIQ